MNNPIDELDDCVNVSDPTHMVDMVDMVDMVEGNLAFSSLLFNFYDQLSAFLGRTSFSTLAWLSLV